MNEIDWYVDRICNKFNESDKDIQILKEELKSNLYDEVDELKKQGFSEEESIKMTLEDFGQENNVISEMNNVWKKKSDFTLMIIKAAIAIFIIGCIFASARIFYKNSIINYESTTSEYVLGDIYSQISKSYFDKTKVATILDNFNKNTNNGLYYIKIEKVNDIIYEYKKDVSPYLAKDAYEGKLKSNNWTIYYKKTDFQQQKDITNLNKVSELQLNAADSVLKNISYLFFSISWIIGCIAFYQYINIEYKSILLVLIAICDIGFGGFFISAQLFPSQVKESFFIIFGTILVIILALKAYFIKNKIRNWK